MSGIMDFYERMTIQHMRPSGMFLKLVEWERNDGADKAVVVGDHIELCRASGAIDTVHPSRSGAREMNVITINSIYVAAADFCESLHFKLDLEAPSHRMAMLRFRDVITGIIKAEVDRDKKGRRRIKQVEEQR